MWIILLWISITEFTLHAQNHPSHASPHTTNHAIAINRPAQVTFANNKTLHCELADNDLTRMIGLSDHRPSPDTCMLFVFDEARVVYFWMPPNMQFNIDIIFIKANGQIDHIEHNAKPCKARSAEHCQKYSSYEEVPYVLEVPVGAAKKNDLRKSQQVQIKLK